MYEYELVLYTPQKSAIWVYFDQFTHRECFYEMCACAEASCACMRQLEAFETGFEPGPGALIYRVLSRKSELLLPQKWQTTGRNSRKGPGCYLITG